MTASRDRAAIVYWAILLAFFPAYLWVHELAGLTFPIPWSDEGTFLWQALAFANDNTLFAPQINPERDIMWMPPGYMIVQGLIFKLTGFSFEWARMLSSLYLMGAMAALAAMFRRPRPSLVYALLCGCFLMNRHFVFMGNIARTDALLLLFVCVGFLVLQRGRPYAAIAILALSPLIHPNGVFFCATSGACFLFGIWKSPKLRRPSGPEVVMVAITLACWLGYAVYASSRWADLVNDMGFALTWKDSAGPTTAAFWRKWVETGQLAHWAVILAALGYGVRRGMSSSAVVALAVALQILGIVATGWMYDIQESLLRLILTVLALQMSVPALGAWAPSRMALDEGRAMAALAVLALGVNYHIGEIEDPRHYPSGLTYKDMTISDSPAYLEPEDRRKLEQLVASVGHANALTRVAIYPWGEAILFTELENERVQLFQPNFHDPDWDVLIVHNSVHIPNDPPLLPTYRIRNRSRDWDVAFERDGTERWVYKDWTKVPGERR